MTDWFDTAVPIDDASAATIARGMREVAMSDGVIHQRELALIASFETHLTVGVSDRASLEGEPLRLTYLRSLIMVALADGVVTDSELERIRELAAEQSIEDRVDDQLLLVKQRFLSVFAGVNVFRESVVRVARDLGLSETELDALSQEA